MPQRNNDDVEYESSALIVLITIIAIAISLVGIIVCFK